MLILEFEGWRFQVDVSSTLEHTNRNSLDHCTCGYCRNYYDTVALCYPQLQTFLDAFGVNMDGPSELMPFEPTCLLACYRIQGNIQNYGSGPIVVDGIPIMPEAAEEGSFFLWVGEVFLPWVQDEPEDEVISPANFPEFLERMEQVWVLRHAKENIFS